MDIAGYWNDVMSQRWELVLALNALVFLLAKPPKTEKERRWDNRILAGFGLLAGLTYFNFGFFHFTGYIHNWDTFHYFVGAKYFPEIGYERLYDCVTVADAEDGFGDAAARRPITDLRDNSLKPTTEVLAHPERCKGQFTAPRWEAFKHDVAYFRAHENPKRWDDMQTDHGFNATPVWMIAGSGLANLFPATHSSILALTLLDPLYWLATCGMIAWAFGWRMLCAALLIFATYFPARFYWTGGSFLRWDWLFFTVTSVCCLRKNRPLLGGFALAYATGLRIFPGVLFVGPVLLALRGLLRWRRMNRQCLHFVLGGALATALLLPIGALSAGDLDAYPAFVRNSVKHAHTPLTNNMGLRTVLAYRPSEAGHILRSDALPEPWAQWKAARLAAFDHVKPLFVALVAAGFLLLWFALRRAEPWNAAVLAATLIAFAFELTSYYYAFILVIALIAMKEQRYAAWLLGLTAFSCLVGLAPLPFMPTWEDEKYTLISFATLLAFAAILIDFARSPSLEAAGAEQAAVSGDAAAGNVARRVRGQK